MVDSVKDRLSAATRHLLKPLLHILLRNGVSYQEFAEWARLAAVQSCREQMQRHGEKPTDSQIAIQTGLTRKEVRRLRELLDNPDDNLQTAMTSKANRATRVLSGWHRDPDFCDANGRPIALPANDMEAGFPALVRRYSGDMPVRAMLEELERVGAVEQRDGNVLPLSRSYLPEADDPQGIRLLGTAVHDLTATIAHNLDQGHANPLRFQRAAVNAELSARLLPILRRMVDERGMDMLKQIDDWMSDHEQESDDKQGPDTRRAGVGIYYFEDDMDSEDGA